MKEEKWWAGKRKREPVAVTCSLLRGSHIGGHCSVGLGTCTEIRHR